MNRSWVRFPQAAQIRPPGSGWAFLYALTGRAAWCARGRRPARWCSGRRVACLDGPGRCVCRWAAARPRDRHTRACGSEWSISRPALALPPPTGTAAWPSGPTCALHTSGAWSLMLLGASPRCPARPRHCPRVSQPGPPLPPAPFTPAAVGGFALHEAFGGCVVGVSDPHVVQFPPIGGGEAAT